MLTDGTERIIDGRLRVFYQGYWIRAYDVPAKAQCETLGTDAEVFEVWTSFVVAGENPCGSQAD